MREEITAGAIATIAIRILVDGVPSAGTATTRIQRASDGKWLDFADSTFKTFGSVGTLTHALASDVNDAGRYAYAWDTGAITNAAAGDVYFATIYVTAPYAYTTTGEISTALVRHGDTTWATAIIAGLATSSAVATVQAGVTTLLTGVTVAALAADAITGTSVASTAVTKLQSGLALASALVTTTVDVVTSRKRLTNRRKIAADGTETIYDDDGVTPLKTRVYTDVTGGPVTINAGEPARASVES